MLRCLREVPYKKPVDVAPGIKAVWAEAGHMLGSASIQLTVEEDGRQKHVVFSGDLGRLGDPILRDFEPFDHADMVFCESTYGDRDHRTVKETIAEFIKIVNEAVKSGGKILVPTFAVGRAQLLVTLLAWMFRTKRAKPFPIYLDSPMAIEATQIYRQHMELFDPDLQKLIKDRPLREDLKLLNPTPTADESRAINAHEGTCLVMAGAGMCNAGRILHHLKANLWKPQTRVLIVGYQSPGSLGRMLVDGAKSVQIQGERIVVKAKVHTLGGFSAHAGQTDLLKWLDVVAASRPRIALVHGEDRARKAFAERIKERFKINPILPAQRELIEV
jgi:metallo-beta-lactamase family protein